MEKKLICTSTWLTLGKSLKKNGINLRISLGRGREKEYMVRSKERSSWYRQRRKENEGTIRSSKKTFVRVAKLKWRVDGGLDQQY